MPRPKISAYIITFNEADKIEGAIKSVLWADEIVVADSASTDGTLEICARYPVRVVQIPFTGFGDLRNNAIAACSHPWIFSLDADERCTDEARDEILAILASPDAADAYLVPRKSYLMGRWVRGCGWYPDYRQTQLFRQGVLKFSNDPVHESFTVSGRTAKMKSAIVQYPFKDFAQMIHKMQRYSTLGVTKMDAYGKRGSMGAAVSHGVWAFFRIYFIKRGCLDGWAGLVIAFYMAEGTFWRYAKWTEKATGRNRIPD